MISNDLKGTHTYNESGTFEVSYITSNDCHSDTTYFQVESMITSIIDTQLNANLSVLQHPFDAALQVNNSSNTDLVYSIFDVKGKVIATGNFKEEIILSTAHWSKGYYVMQVENKEGKKGVLKLIKG